ncbi:TGF-beta-activated kinase 1 and MAP3K7-binding protein 1-like [Mytilus edulis]|uniref:TGF-beta-activated kinase 1 and MAP3K7-binding protein 1 n=2 Tax=Mytilus TaxID=6548 RepID=W5XLL0_MYTGA|nr:TGF-beta-activated kinase 1 and MAP3K7-binding protein [Mytilus galloprovincialis]CAG2235062.1 MAP3K7IP1 [Mytilus edulis]
MAATRLANGSVGSPPRLGSHALSWTDDLPVCQLSGVGFSTNQLYREDGFRQEEHEFEDRSFHFRLLDTESFLYGVFDGHDGSRVANFAAQRMPAELLLGQLNNNNTDEEIKEILYQAFIAVEKSFFESIDHIFAEKTTIQLQLPEGISHYEACKQYPDTMKQLDNLEKEISGGTTATVSLIYKNKLFVANVGDTRALLCITDQEGMLRVMQLSVDHSLVNEEECNRMALLGLDMEKLKQHRLIGSSDSTRCLGDYHVKGGYKDIDLLLDASREPVIADPYVHGGIPLDKSSSFLIIMSDGLYQALQDAIQCDRVNVEVARMVAAEFSIQGTLHGVAQAVVDKVVRMHHDAYMTGTPEIKSLCKKRGDITLLVRNFNYPLANAINSPNRTGPYNPLSPPTPARIPSHLPLTPSISIELSDHSSSQSPAGTPTPTKQRSPPRDIMLTTTSTLASTLPDSTLNTSNGGTSTESSTQSSGDTRFPSRFYQCAKLELDEDGKIEPYVDFSDFYKAIAELTEAQRETLNAETNPKSGYETITEESETSLTSGPEN